LIDWSYDNLSDRDKLALEHVSVFSGGFVLNDVQAMFSALGLPPWQAVDAIGSLVDKSLVHAAEKSTGMRYDLLETVRQYAVERLTDRGSTAARAARDAHLDVFVDLAERERPALRGPDQRASVERLSAEVDNFRAALTYGVEAGSTRHRCARLADAFIRLAWRTGALREDLTSVHQRLLDDASLPVELRVNLLTNLADQLIPISISGARNLADEALELSRESGDAELVATATSAMGWIELVQGNHDRALMLAAEVEQLAASIDDLWTLHWLRSGFVALAEFAADPDASRQALEEALAFFTAERDHYSRGATLLNMGVNELAAGRFELARALLVESRQALVDAGTSAASELPYDLGLAAYGLGELDGACNEFGEALRIDIASGNWRRVGFDLLAAAFVASHTGQLRDAARLHRASRHVMTEVGGTFEQFLVDWAERDLASLRRQLGDSGFDQAVSDGDKLPRRDAIELAREMLGSLRHQESA
jgi:tetratricopeptide (TPR) repeat protein